MVMHGGASKAAGFDWIVKHRFSHGRRYAIAAKQKHILPGLIECGRSVVSAAAARLNRSAAALGSGALGSAAAAEPPPAAPQPVSCVSFLRALPNGSAPALAMLRAQPRPAGKYSSNATQEALRATAAELRTTGAGADCFPRRVKVGGLEKGETTVGSAWCRVQFGSRRRLVPPAYSDSSV
jgi:hypothetical protein